MEGTNLLGKSHKKYVQEQIKVRQEKLGKSNKDSTDLSWMNGKTSWVRLASSVNVENSTVRIPATSRDLFLNANYKAGGDTTGHQNVSPDINKIIEINLNSLNEANEIGTDVEVPTGEQRLQLLGFGNEWMGNALAKNLVLIGGTEPHRITTTEDGFTVNRIKRKGVAPTSFPVYQGKDFGLVAMPGIQSVDVKSKSMGSLREANISIRVNDASQLELIETIYLRLGYSMFLEWGNSSYFKNDGEYIKGALAEPGLIYDFLLQESPTQQDIDRILITRMFDLDGDGVEDPLTEEQIEYFKSQLDSVQIFSQKIEEERKKSCGNYDAMFGKVSNFSWEFDPSGFYNVSLTLISWGDIIESLNINSFFPDIDLIIDSEGNIKKGEVDRKNSSALEAFIYESTLQDGNSWESEGKIINATLKPTKNTLLSNNVTKTGEFKLFNTSTWGGPKTETQSASDYSDVLKYDRSQTNSNGKVIGCNAVFGNNRVYKYVRFGDLLDFIKHKLLIYNNIAPIIDIDTTPGRNFCYNPKINVSADPSKVMIRRDLPPFTKKDLTPQELSEVGGFLTAGEYQITEGVFNSKLPYNDADVETFIESFDTKIPGVDVEGGDIMNIYFEKDYLYLEIDNLINSKTGKISLYKFVKKLLDTANSCLGGVNQLDLRIRDDRTLEIYDQVPLYGVKKEEPIQQFNIYGVQENRGSFVTNFGLKTELTNEFATMVTIGAQAQGDVVGEDATMLSRWNFGLVDRFIPKKIDSLARDFKEKDKEFKEFTALTEKIKSLWRAYQIQAYGDLYKAEGEVTALNFPLMFKQETFASYVTLQKNFFRAFIKLETNTHSSNPYRMSNQIGMLPINLNLEMDGLSGIRIYDQINVDTRFLPSYYPNYLIFIVKGVSHTFVGNKWVTKIDTIAQPKVQYQEDLGLQKKFFYKPIELPAEEEEILPPLVVPNATRLRGVLDELFYVEKGEEIAEAGDITFEMAEAAIAVFRTISSEIPSLNVRVTSGNDAEHAAITDYTSFHTIGKSIDFTISPASEANQKAVVQILKEFAADPANNFGYIDEYSNPTKEATGYHYHMVIGGGRLATQNRNEAIAMAKEGQLTPRSFLESSLLDLARQQLNDANR